MIRLKNGIAEMSCAREKEKETRKSGLARGKHGEITLLDTHVWGGTAVLRFQVLCTAAAIDNAFNIQVIPHRSKRKDKVKWEKKWGHILGWLQEWSKKDPTAFEIYALIVKQGKFENRFHRVS